jgi:hypothetical protein
MTTQLDHPTTTARPTCGRPTPWAGTTCNLAAGHPGAEHVPTAAAIRHAEIAATRPDNPFAHAVTLATLLTETAVVIGTTTVRPRRLSVFDYGDGAYTWTIEVHVTTPAEVDEVGRAFALPLVDWADTLHVRYWSGVSLAGDLVNLRVLAGNR